MSECQTNFNPMFPWGCLAELLTVMKNDNLTIYQQVTRATALICWILGCTLSTVTESPTPILYSTLEVPHSISGCIAELGSIYDQATQSSNFAASTTINPIVQALLLKLLQLLIEELLSN